MIRPTSNFSRISPEIKVRWGLLGSVLTASPAAPSNFDSNDPLSSPICCCAFYCGVASIATNPAPSAPCCLKPAIVKVVPSTTRPTTCCQVSPVFPPKFLTFQSNQGNRGKFHMLPHFSTERSEELCGNYHVGGRPARLFCTASLPRPQGRVRRARPR